MAEAIDIGRAVVAARKRGEAWKDIVERHGLSRQRLSDLAAAARVADQKCQVDITVIAGTPTPDVVAEEACCATCPAYAVRTTLPHGRPLTVGECRFNPEPVRKEPTDWCARHPVRRVRMEG